MREIINYANTIKNIIKETMENVDVQVQTVMKNNGKEYTGIVISEENTNIAPTIYIDSMYEEGIGVAGAALEVMNIYKENKQPGMDMEFYKDYNKVAPMLKARLVNERNTQYAGISAEEYGYPDLKIVPYINIEIGDSTGSIIVKDEHIKLWNVDVKDVVKRALENIREDVEIQTMAQFMAKMMGMEAEEGTPLDDILIVTNKEKTYGAISVIAAANAVRDRIGEKYTVLPSSIHEVIILKQDANDELKAIVNEVNRTAVKPEDYLSDNVYQIAA